MADPMTSEQLAELREQIKRAHEELGTVCAERPSRRFRMSVPADQKRDSDLIIGAGLDAGELLAAEVERLRAGLHALAARCEQGARDNGDHYNRTGAQYEHGKAVVWDAAAEEIRALLAGPRPAEKPSAAAGGACSEHGPCPAHGGEAAR